MSEEEVHTYDYIIAGAGLAGLSLLHRMLAADLLDGKRLLVLDAQQKNENDRTWCYWEKEPGPFEEIVYHKWQTLDFFGPNLHRRFALEEYTYKMIRGIDFYRHVQQSIAKCSNITYLQEEITDLAANKSAASVTTSQGTYTAPLVFNSTPILQPKLSQQDTLLQHFTGWVIETEEPSFDPTIGTLMDFRVQQKGGATFMYVLPTSSKRALVEYTLFSPAILQKEAYEKELRAYIKGTLGLEDYTISETEFGIIPMSLHRFPKHHNGTVINIGTAGGHTKASSGYTFQFVQNHVGEMVANLKGGLHPLTGSKMRQKVYDWYDRTLLEVLLSGRMEGRDIFTTMFKKLPGEKILAFLANDSDLSDDLHIMSSLPTSKFLPAGIKQLLPARH